MEKIIEYAYKGLKFTDQAVQSEKIPVRVGDLEIALLKKVKVVIRTNADGLAHNIAWALFRKSDDAWPHTGVNPWEMDSKNSDIVLSGYFWHECFDDGAALGLEGDTIQFPDPGIVLIRQPQLIAVSTQAGGVDCGIGMHCYYEVKKVSAADMTKYMVRDKGDNKG